MLLFIVIDFDVFLMIRKVAGDTDKYYNNHFVILHDLLRDLAIYQSSQEAFEERRRLIIDLTENNHPEWWPEQKQQGVIPRMLSLFFRWWVAKKQQINAHTLSIYAGQSVCLSLSV